MTPDALTIGQIIGWVSDVGSLALVLSALWSGMRGYWVFGHMHREVVDRLVAENAALKTERDHLLGLALRSTKLATSLVGTNELSPPKEET